MAPRIILSPSDRVLRCMTILLLAPTIAFTLPHGITTHHEFPALGILPMTFSSISGIVHLSGRAAARHRTTNILVDIFLAVFIIAFLIPSWIYLATSSGYWGDGGLVMLGTYGTVGMMGAFCIHSFFALRDISWRRLLSSPFSSSRDVVCPHCDRQIHGPKAKEQQNVTESKAAYQPLDTPTPEPFHDARASTDEYDEGRPSTDDETARLV